MGTKLDPLRVSEGQAPAFVSVLEWKSLSFASYILVGLFAVTYLFFSLKEFFFFFFLKSTFRFTT